MSFANSVSIGDILYFKSDKLKSDLPHYFVCVAKDDSSTVFTVVVTSQIASTVKHFERCAIPHNELVMVAPSHNNPLTKESCISCRNVFDFTAVELDTRHSKKEISIKGKLEEDYVEQIIKGMKSSRVIERNIKVLLPNF